MSKYNIAGNKDFGRGNIYSGENVLNENVATLWTKSSELRHDDTTDYSAVVSHNI